MTNFFQTVFVTVGTTKFDELVREIDSTEFQAYMVSLGTRRIIVQYGSSRVIPQSRISGILMEAYAFKPNLTADMTQAELIIAHCGAGTILEILRLQKKAVCVVNSNLLDNHQIELADEMRTRSLMTIAYSPNNIIDVLRESDWNKIKLYEKPDSGAFLKELTTLLMPSVSIDKDIGLVLTAIRNRRSNVFMKSLFRTINKSYRECIDRAQERLNEAFQSSDSSDVDRASKSTITLTQLKESLAPGEKVITELDLVENVFDIVKSEISKTIPINAPINGPMIEYQYFFSIVMAYAQSLLGFLIYPHRRLQMFMYDLCIDSNNMSGLQQLLNFHVILDSTDLLDRLILLFKSKKVSWSAQTLLDVAKRMARTDVVTDTLLELDRPMDIIEYIRMNDLKYEIEKVFVSLKKYPNVNKSIIWSQVELWNLTTCEIKPILSHQVIMLNSIVP